MLIYCGLVVVTKEHNIVLLSLGAMWCAVHKVHHSWMAGWQSATNRIIYIVIRSVNVWQWVVGSKYGLQSVAYFMNGAVFSYQEICWVRREPWGHGFVNITFRLIEERWETQLFFSSSVNLKIWLMKKSRVSDAECFIQSLIVESWDNKSVGVAFVELWTLVTRDFATYFAHSRIVAPLCGVGITWVH